MKKIDNYAILGKNKYCDDWIFIDGYKTLPTLRKRFMTILDVFRSKSVSYDSIILCSRDEDKNILKLYYRVDK